MSENKLFERRKAKVLRDIIEDNMEYVSPFEDMGHSKPIKTGIEYIVGFTQKDDDCALANIYRKGDIDKAKASIVKNNDEYSLELRIPNK